MSLNNNFLMQGQERNGTFTTIRIVGGLDTDRSVDLDINGGTKIKKRLNVGGDIETQGNLIVGDSLEVTGETINENLYVNDTLYVDSIIPNSDVPSIIINADLLLLGNLITSANIIYGPVENTDKLIKVSGIDSIEETGISVDNSNNVTGINDLTIDGEAAFSIINVSISFYPIKPAGSLAYDTLSEQIYISNGVTWQTPSVVVALPPPLQSIANLTTAGNEIIYTTASDTYATSSISAAGRSFLSLTSASAQRTGLGLVIGTDVQAQSSNLDTLNTIANGAADRIIRTTGPGFTSSPITPYAYNTILQFSSASDMANAINTIQGSFSTPNRITKVLNNSEIVESGVSIDSFNNMTGIDNLNATSLITTNANIISDIIVGGNLDGITIHERDQLRNINNNIISTTTWTNLSAIDQSLSTTSTPTFNGADMSGQIVSNLSDPSAPQDAATKYYVDLVASTGAPPLIAVKYASSNPLNNSPVYSNTFQTLTSSSGAGIAFEIDNITTIISDVGVRILVKNQVDTRQNGIYLLSDYGGGINPWQLTRSTDFSQSSMPKPAGSTVFVEPILGTTNGSTSWTLGETISNINPLNESVEWIQTGGSEIYAPSNGIDTVQFQTGIITTSITPRLKYTTGALDLNVIPTTYGGTGTAIDANTVNTVLISNGTNPLDMSKQAPSGQFVGTTDTQSLTNKTITDITNTIRATTLGTNSSNTNVNIITSSPPTVGQVLTATASNTAIWQDIPPAVEPQRTLFVYQGASGVSPNFPSLQSAITAAISLGPTSNNWVHIQIFPGTYVETIPIQIPGFVSISSLTAAQSDVIIRPSAPAPSSPVLLLSGNARVSGLVIDGFDGASNNATIGVSSVLGVLNSLDYVTSMTVRNCTIAGFQVTGSTGTQYSKFLVCKNTSVQVTQVGLTMTSGYEALQAGVLNGIDLNVSGFFVAGLAGIITYGFYIHDDFSFIDVSAIQATQVTYGVRVGGAVSSSQGLYPIFRLNSGLFSRVSTVGVFIDSKAVIRANDMKVQDDTGLYPSQLHLYIVNPPLPNDPNLLVGLYSNIRTDLFYQTGAVNNPPIMAGSNLSETPDSVRNLFGSGVDVGYIGNGRSLTVGEGRPINLGMVIFSYDTISTTFTNLTSRLNKAAPIVNDVDIATTTQIDIDSPPSTIDDVTPVVGITRILVKDGSTANPNASGYSVDNGVYLWNGPGVPMTRTTDFSAGAQVSDRTWFAVGPNGTVNYGSRYKLNGKSGTFNVTNITIGTTKLYLEPSSAKPFSNTDGNAIYIGNALLTQFSGLLTHTCIPLTTTGGVTSHDVIEWEYWNGSAWVHLPLGSTWDAQPYYSRSSYTFGYSDTILPGEILKVNYQFGKISDTWGTTTVNGVLAYWVRAIVTDAANIITIPVMEEILLQTNHVELGVDGYIEYYGNSRPIVREEIPLIKLMPTGSDPAPYAIRLISSTSPYSISKIVPNSVFEAGIDTSACFSWDSPKHISHACGIKMTIRFSVPSGGVPTSVTWRADYVIVKQDDSVGSKNTSPSPNNSSHSTTFTINVSPTDQGVSVGYTYLDTTYMFENNDCVSIWCKLTRLGSSDAYGQDVYLQSIFFEFALRAQGSHFTLF